MKMAFPNLLSRYNLLHILMSHRISRLISAFNVHSAPLINSAISNFSIPEKKYGNAENRTWGCWVRSEKKIHCAMRPPHPRHEKFSCLIGLLLSLLNERRFSSFFADHTEPIFRAPVSGCFEVNDALLPPPPLLLLPLLLLLLLLLL